MFNSTPMPYSTALTACPFGTHLTTINAPNVSVSRLLDTALGVANYFSATGLNIWLGCSQAWAQPYKNYGWSWVDGTSNSNLYTGVNNVSNYGIWFSINPK